jgi:hypothetical protein
VTDVDRAKWVALVDAQARLLGMRLVYLPVPDADGFVACADCGRPIVEQDGSYWLHASSGIHGCRFGEGCAHPHEPTSIDDIYQPPSEGEHQE